MEFQLSEDFVKDNGLTEEQVKAVTSHVDSKYIPELKKTWDGKANEQAEGILTGAAKYAAEKFNVKVDREQGEKWGDYLNRIADTSLSTAKQELAEKQKEIDEKLKNFKGGDEYKQQLDTLKQEKDALLKTVAELEPLKGLDAKYKEATEQLSGLKLNVAFNSTKPNFPDTVNKYEADAKWNAFKDGILKDYEIELNDQNEPVAISKENKYTQHKLSDLVAKDEELTALLQGRQQGGTGARPADKLKVDGLPFDIPKGATSEELSKLVRDYVEKELKIPFADPKYATKFQEFYSKAREGLKAA